MKTSFPSLSATRSARVRVAHSTWSELTQLAFRRHPCREWGTYFRFGYRRTAWGLALSIVDLVPPQPGDLLRTSPIVSFSPEYISRSIDVRDGTRLGVGFVHSHPLGWGVTPSPSDDDMDEYFARLSLPYGSGQPYVTLIVNRDSSGTLVFSGRVFDRGEWMPVSHLHVVGSTLARYQNALWHNPAPHDSSRAKEVLARWTTLAGEATAGQLTGATIGILGCSGTGSPAVEILARSQVGRFVLVDGQRFAISNLERLHGSAWVDAAGSPLPFKVELMAALIRGINPDARLTALVGNALDNEVLDELLQCDFVLGCTDTLHGRAVLGDLASLYLVPAIDVGVLPRGQDGRLTAQLIELSRHGPADPCPFCQGRIPPAALHAELMSPEQQQQCREAAEAALARGEDGSRYWQGGPPQVPAIGYLTTIAGAMAAGYGLNWLLGTASMPHSRMQLDLGQPELGFVGLEEGRTPQCGCTRYLAHGDQGERSVTRPAHFPPTLRL